MFEMMFGPQPPRELIENRADNVSEQSAVMAWITGYTDGVSGNDYKVMVEAPDLQPIYKPAFDRGADDRKAAQALQGEDAKEEKEEPWHPSRLAYKPVLRDASWTLRFYQDDIKSVLYLSATVLVLVTTARKLTGRE